MNLYKISGLSLLLLLSISSIATSIDGVVKFNKKSSPGTLFIYAKKFDGSLPMPILVKRVNSPKFPYKFSLTEKNKMMAGLPFEGPFKVMARLSPSGDVMDKTGQQASTDKPIKIGAKNIILNLK